MRVKASDLELSIIETIHQMRILRRTGAISPDKLDDYVEYIRQADDLLNDALTEIEEG